MKKAYIFLADGFEEVEGLTAVDLLRRAGIEVVMVSIKDDVNIKGARGINVVADTTISESLTDADMVILPGGMPGTNYLKASDEVKNLVNAYNDAGKYVAAICAAPTVFGEMGILQGKKATCYPGLEHGLLGAMLPGEDYSVVQDGNIITSRGVGTAIDFALKLIEEWENDYLMKGILIKDIIEFTNGHLIGKIDDSFKDELLNKEVKDIVIDSRQVNPDSLFVALKGERVDAHRFIPDTALKTDAILTEESEEEIMSQSEKESLPENKAYIKVDSTLDAMQDIAAAIRKNYNKPIVGVTGSVGKTTTREMITTALSSNISVFHTEGNMNSQIGVPITVSRINDNPSEAAVLEMGISEPGGMDRLTRMVNPDIAVVTMIGQAHIEFLKTREGIRDEKLRITGRMNENGALFLNADDEMLYALKGKTGVKTFYYGTGEDADYRAENIRFENGYNNYTFVHGDERIEVKLSVLGTHNVLNSLVAMAVSDYMGLDLGKAAKSFESFVGLRQKIILSDKKYTIIDDSYNASPDSMKAAINVLRDMNVKGRKIAVLGDMFELGENSRQYHKDVGIYIAEQFNSGALDLDELITIGDESKEITDYVKANTDIKTSSFDEKPEASEYIKSILKADDVITLKASNGMKFAEIVEALK